MKNKQIYQNEQVGLQAKMLEEAEKVILDLTNKVYNRKNMPSDFVGAMEHLISHLPEDKPLPEPFCTFKMLKFNNMMKPVLGRLEMFNTGEVLEDYKKIQF